MNAVQRRYPQIYKSSEWLLLAPESIGVGLRDFMISVKSKLPRCLRLAHCLCLFTSRPSALQTSVRGLRRPHIPPAITLRSLNECEGARRPHIHPTATLHSPNEVRGSFVEPIHPPPPPSALQTSERCSSTPHTPNYHPPLSKRARWGFVDPPHPPPPPSALQTSERC